MRLRVALLLGLVLVAAGCAGAPAPTDDGAATPTPAPTTPAPTPTPYPSPTPTPTPTPEPVLTLVTTVAPLTDLVAQVGGERALVETLVPAGADSHTYEPRPGDVALFNEADAFIGIGLDLNEAAVRLAVENLPDGAPVVLLGEAVLDADGLIHDHDHSHGHGPEHSHDHEHSHDEGSGPNPHVWMSVRLAMDLVDGVVDTLAELDPAGSQHYEDRARAYLLELRDLDEAIGTATAAIPDGRRRLVTYHDAWSYFARDYDLELVTAVQPANFSEPSAAEVRAIIDLIREHDVPAVFGSEVFPSDVLDAIAEETGAVYVGDLVDDVLPGQPGDAEHSYVGLMRRNAKLIAEALGGDPAPLAALD